MPLSGRPKTLGTSLYVPRDTTPLSSMTPARRQVFFSRALCVQMPTLEARYVPWQMQPFTMSLDFGAAWCKHVVHVMQVKTAARDLSEAAKAAGADCEVTVTLLLLWMRRTGAGGGTS